MHKKSVIIIGAGVIGLTTALQLIKNNYQVILLAKEFEPNLTSNVAGALWEWPPAVCGYHSDQISLERSKVWCMISYHKFYELAKQDSTGVHIRDAFFFFRQDIEKNEVNFNKMLELKDQVKGFKRGRYLIGEEGINQNLGLVDAYAHKAPMIDTDIYMNWLMKQCLDLGVQFEQREIAGKLSDCSSQLLTEYNSNIIINCSGLGSKELADEYMYPLRGALVRLKQPLEDQNKLSKAYCISFDEQSREQNIVFIVPRGKTHVVLGALAEENQYDKNINLENYKPIQEMYDRCKEFLPKIKDFEIDRNEEVRVGLRPFRKGNVRLEIIPELNVIHNYGHGGAGVTFSWGCAEEILKLVNEQLK